VATQYIVAKAGGGGVVAEPWWHLLCWMELLLCLGWRSSRCHLEGLRRGRLVVVDPLDAFGLVLGSILLLCVVVRVC
jgi:hypothetical protein